jgi:hypothetical protein
MLSLSPLCLAVWDDASVTGAHVIEHVGLFDFCKLEHAIDDMYGRREKEVASCEPDKTRNGQLCDYQIKAFG